MAQSEGWTETAPYDTHNSPVKRLVSTDAYIHLGISLAVASHRCPAVLQAFRRVAEEEMKVRAAGLPKREDLMVHKLQELCVMAVRQTSSWEILVVSISSRGRS